MVEIGFLTDESAIKVTKMEEGRYHVERLNTTDSVTITFAENGAKMLFDGESVEVEEFFAILGMLEQVDHLQCPVIFTGETGIWTEA